MDREKVNFVVDQLIIQLDKWNNRQYLEDKVNVDVLIRKLYKIRECKKLDAMQSSYQAFLHILVERKPPELGEFLRRELLELELEILNRN
ncbi:hypothetical protein [Flammeovirga sp. SJP92]|uniref:hypothetical protein n=1 Tax=Flammeovirga sp. SJP92 TaxID=1775430 RepID=UPI0007884A8E|nr:hypothetical protein [Flammeovirga sp. SJP92]KXX69786.1 hypothetical protein AVL50_12920 [Flammeovirga sp. SJP92]